MDQIYSSVDTDDMTVTSNAYPAAELNASLGLDDVVVSTAEGDPVEETPEQQATRERDEAGRFKAKDAKEDETPKVDPKVKARDNPVERMKAATAKEAEAKREREAAQKERDEIKAEAAQLRAQLEALRAPKQEPVRARVAAQPTNDDPEPDAADASRYPNGEYDKSYIKDLGRWSARQESRDLEAKRQKDTQAQQQQSYRARVERDWADRLTKAQAATPDWATRYNERTPLDERMIPHIQTLEDGPELMLYLSDHQDFAQRLATLPPIQQVAELGKVSGRLAAAKESRGTAASPVPSKASAPITPLGGGSHVTPDEGSDDESFDAFYARDQKARRGRHA